MNEFKVIPAIDLIDGKCVRLEKGEYDRVKTYEQDPLEMAYRLEGAGLNYLHIVDLDGAKSGRIVNFPVLESICSKTSLQVDFGGGLKHSSDLKIAFESGARQVSVGSVAVKQPDVFISWIDEFGADRIILSADAKEGQVAMNAWQDVSDQSVEAFIKKYQAHGIKDVVCTDISKDGMMAGPGYELYLGLMNDLEGVSLIASGGVRNASDLTQLKQMGMAGAIVGKAMYEGKISLEEMRLF